MTGEIDDNPYLQKVHLKRQQNKQKLDELGIGESYQLQKKKNRAVPIKKNYQSKHSPPRSLRRSARKANKPVQFSGIDDLTDSRVEVPRRSTRKANKPVQFSGIGDPQVEAVKMIILVKRQQATKKSKYNSQYILSANQRRKFGSIPTAEWVEDLEYYLDKVLGDSKSNQMRVLLTVEKLVHGKGVQHPQSRKYFKKNIMINLGLDFDALIDQATEWLLVNGPDKGNGWLVQYPIKKIKQYQYARHENGGKPFSS